MQSANLTYDQVRDQTRNLCVEGFILSHIGKEASAATLSDRPVQNRPIKPQPSP